YPCLDCARGIVQSGIRRLLVPVVDYDDGTWGASFRTSTIILEEGRVEVIQVDGPAAADRDMATPDMASTPGCARSRSTRPGDGGTFPKRVGKPMHTRTHKTTKRLRLKELAAHLDLSITTVSRALAGYSDVSEDTRRRVREAAD